MFKEACMKKLFILLIFAFAFELNSLTLDDSFVTLEPFKPKQQKFYYPIITLNTEIGERFAFNPFEDLTEEDYQQEDYYKFYLGYAKILQHITKKSKVDFMYMFKNKDYEVEEKYSNKSDSFSFSFLYEILPDLTADLGLNYKRMDFSTRDNFDNKQFSPEVEVKYKPRKNTLFGVKYVFQNTRYTDTSKDWSGNRVLIYWQQQIFDNKLRFRIRYRGENRDYRQETKQRQDSFKYSISATAIIDFN